LSWVAKPRLYSSIPTIGFNTKRVQKGHVTLKWSVSESAPGVAFIQLILTQLGSWRPAAVSTNVGAILPRG
jgi:hypothetical protein